jgi:hypothetical protein
VACFKEEYYPNIRVERQRESTKSLSGWATTTSRFEPGISRIQEYRLAENKYGAIGPKPMHITPLKYGTKL